MLVSILIILLKTEAAIGVVEAKTVASHIIFIHLVFYMGIAWDEVDGVRRGAHLIKSYDFICETLVEVHVIVDEERTIVDADEPHVAGSVVRIVFNAVVHGHLDP